MTTTSTKYKRYAKYKPSGIDWLGDIPEAWEVKPLKHISEIVLGKMLQPEQEKDTEQYKPYLRAENIRWEKPNVSDVNEMWISLAERTSLRLQKDDLLVSEGGEVGRTSIWANELDECYIQNSVNRVRVKIGVTDSRYILYVFECYANKGFFDAYVNKVSIAHLTRDKLKEVDIVMPALDKQRAIADFLDHQTAKIDKVVAKKQKLIELLKEKRQALITHAVTKGLDPKAKMKPSGIDWLGDIPEGWEVKRLKYLSDTRVSNVDKKSEDEMPVRLCNYVDVYYNEFINEQLDFMIATATKDQVEKFELKRGDVILTKDSETPDDIGIPAYVDLENTNNVVCGYHLAISTPSKSKLSGKYLFRLFQSNNYRSYFEVSSNGVTRFGLDTYSVFNADIPLPDLVEQRAIADFLDRETAKIDEVMKKVESQIEKLCEYRQALITSAVTGKIMVN